MAAVASFVLVAILVGVDGCGMTTHQTISHRALMALYDSAEYPAMRTLLESQKDSLFAGSPYPDYLYTCGNNHDDGEFTHWGTFQALSAQYIRAQYPQPWNDTAQKLVAFIAGVVSHSIADVNWHGMVQVPSGYGMIETIGGVDFNCTGGINTYAMVCEDGSQGADPPHTEADTGGEFLAAYQTDLDWEHPDDWYIPVSDLVNIYALDNRTVNASAIEECAYIFWLATAAVKALASTVEPMEVAKSPTFAEHYIDLPLGGIDDMAVWAGYMWRRWAQWLYQGPPVIPPPDAPHSVAGSSWRHTPAQARFKDLMRVLAPLAAERIGATKRRDAAGGVSFSAARRADADGDDLWLLRALRKLLLSPSKSSILPSGASASPASLYSWARPQTDDAAPATVAARTLAVLRDAGFGAHVAHFGAASSGSGGSSLAPDVRTLLAFLAAAESHLLATPPAPPGNATVVGVPLVTLASALPLEYAGASLAVGDFNGDGTDDVAMGAWGHTINPAPTAKTGGEAASAPRMLMQAGAVYTQYGNSTVRAPAASPAPPIPFPDAPTYGAELFARLGWSMCALDFNADGVDDLAASAPTQNWDWAAPPVTPQFNYSGAVHVFFGSRGGGGLSSAPNVSILSFANNSHVGSGALLCADVNGDGLRDLLIGSHLAFADVDTVAERDATERGRFDAFFSSAAYAGAGASGAPLALDVFSAANLTANGSTPYAWLGYAMAAEPGVSVPAAAWRASLKPALALPGIAATCKAEAAAFDDSSRTPSAAVSATLLALGAPGWRSPALEPVGATLVYALPPPASPAGRLAACVSRAASGGSGGPAPLPPPLYTLQGRAGLDTNRWATAKFGGALALGRPSGPGTPLVLAVGIPCTDGNRTTGIAKLNSSSGAVALFDALPAAASAAPAQLSTLLGSMPDARFGWQLLFGDVTGDGVQDFVVAAPMYTPHFISSKGLNLRAGAGRVDEVGAVFVFAGGAAFAPLLQGTHWAVEDSAAWRAEGAARFGRLGSALSVADWDGDGTAELILGAPRATVVIPTGTAMTEIAVRSRAAQATTGVEMPGAVFVYKVAV